MLRVTAGLGLYELLSCATRNTVAVMCTQRYRKAKAKVHPANFVREVLHCNSRKDRVSSPTIFVESLHFASSQSVTEAIAETKI